MFLKVRAVVRAAFGLAAALLLTGLGGVTSASGAPDAPSTAPAISPATLTAKPAADAHANVMVCEEERLTGSHLSSTVCMTSAQRWHMEELSQRQIEDTQNGRPRASGGLSPH